MIVRLSILALLSGAFGTAVTAAYGYVFAKNLTDFGSYAPSLLYSVAYNFVITIGAAILFFVIHKASKRFYLTDFIISFGLAVVAVVLTLMTSLNEFPNFSGNMDLEIMSFMYFALVMPMIYFPVLSWFAFKPLIIKKD